jgi:hypothetical protein
MEFYRSLPNCALYLDPASFPVKNAGSAPTGRHDGLLSVAFFDKSATLRQKLAPWATTATDSTAITAWNIDSDLLHRPASTGVTNAINTAVAGPDGTKYTVYTPWCSSS